VPFADIWVPYTTDRSDTYRQEIVGDMRGLFLARRRADLPGIRSAMRSRSLRVPADDPKAFKKVTAQAETIFDTDARVVAAAGAAEGGRTGARLSVVLLA